MNTKGTTRWRLTMVLILFNYIYISFWHWMKRKTEAEQMQNDKCYRRMAVRANVCVKERRRHWWTDKIQVRENRCGEEFRDGGRKGWLTALFLTYFHNICLLPHLWAQVCVWSKHWLTLHSWLYEGCPSLKQRLTSIRCTHHTGIIMNDF